jgi:hypothetical protein
MDEAERAGRAGDLMLDTYRPEPEPRPSQPPDTTSKPN